MFDRSVLILTPRSNDSGFFSDGQESDTRRVYGRGAGRTILYVEDDPGDVMLLRRALDDLGRQVRLVVFSDSAEALLACATADLAPDLIVLDINLPKIGGMQLLSLIKAMPRFIETKVVLLTTSRNDRYEQQARTGGADGYFLKPFGFGEYADIAATFLSLAGVDRPQ